MIDKVLKVDSILFNLSMRILFLMSSLAQLKAGVASKFSCERGKGIFYATIMMRQVLILVL